MKKASILFLTIAFSTLSLAQEKLHIKGKLKGLTEEASLILISGEQQIEIPKKGEEFEVEMKLSEAPAPVYLVVKEGQGVKNTRFFLGHETVVIEGSMDNFSQDIQAVPSENDKLRYENYLASKSLRFEITQLQQDMMELLRRGEQQDLVSAFYYSEKAPVGKITKVLREVDKIDYVFIEQHINTAYGRSMLQFVMDRFTDEELQHLFDLVDPQYKDTKEVKYLDALIHYKKLAVGDSFYDFTALDQEGNTVHFRDLFQGKPLLLDFSTMNCRTCQEVAPQTAQLAEELKDQLTYVTYYVDNKEDIMEMYYELKNKKGLMLWNKAGRLDIAYAKYKNYGTPSYILFDAQGIVRQVESGYVEDFEQEVKAWLKK